MTARVRRSSSQTGGGGGSPQAIALAEAGTVTVSACKRAELFCAMYFNGTQLAGSALGGDASGMTSFQYAPYSTNTHAVELFLRQATAPATGSYSVTGKSWAVLSVAAIDGVDVAATITAAAKAYATGTSAAAVCPTVSGAAVGDLHVLVYMCQTGGGAGVVTPPAGYTRQLFGVPEGAAYCRVVQAGDLTGSTLAAQTLTLTNSVNWVAVSVVLKATATQAPSYRYFRLRSTEALVSNTMTAAEINLLDSGGSAITRAGWTLGASSAHPGSPLANTIDASTSSFWETDWSQPGGTVGAVAPPYHWQADLGSAQAVSALRYTPRGSSVGSNGTVGYWDIYGSPDGATWTLLTGGYLPDFGAIDGNATRQFPIEETVSGGSPTILSGVGVGVAAGVAVAASVATQRAPGVGVAQTVAVAAGIAVASGAWLGWGDSVAIGVGLSVAHGAGDGVSVGRAAALGIGTAIQRAPGVGAFATAAIGVGSAVQTGAGFGTGVSAGYLTAIAVGRALQVVDGVSAGRLYAIDGGRSAPVFVSAIRPGRRIAGGTYNPRRRRV